MPVDDFDIAIGAIALSHDAEVVTANLPHFGRFEGLACRDWIGRPEYGRHPAERGFFQANLSCTCSERGCIPRCLSKNPAIAL